MKLGLMLGYSGARVTLPMDMVTEAESLGFDSVWTAEAWGSDAVTPVAWMLANTKNIKIGTAIMQMSARTPSMTAMTAMTLDQLSGGRFVLGIGPSGPQVIEGWYGQPYGKPLARTREYISIVRQIFERKKPLMHVGEHYQIPYTGEGSLGLGKPLKSIVHGNPNIPIYTGVATEKGVKVAAECADGCFLVWTNPDKFNLWKKPLETGFSNSKKKKSMSTFDFAPFVRISMGNDVERCRIPIKQGLALYVGGMGARKKNFYNDYTKRLGYEDAAEKIQNLYLSGKKEAAVKAVPDEYVDETSLVGPPERIKEQLQRWVEAEKRQELGTMIVSANNVNELRFLAENLL